MKVLVIEDSQRLRKALKEGLSRSGFVVDMAKDGEEGLRYVYANEYDVVVLDILMPKLDGLTLLKRIRQEGNEVSVLILSAKEFVEDRVKGLEAGADDYLVKPFSFDELLARLRSLARRRSDQKSPVIDAGMVKLDTVGRRVTAYGTEVELTRAEYNILEQLMLGRGRVLSKAHLLDRIHDSDSDTSDNLIEVLVSGLRKKFRRAGVDDFLKTRRGFGYYIDADFPGSAASGSKS